MIRFKMRKTKIAKADERKLITSVSLAVHKTDQILFIHYEDGSCECFEYENMKYSIIDLKILTKRIK